MEVLSRLRKLFQLFFVDGFFYVHFELILTRIYIRRFLFYFQELEEIYQKKIRVCFLFFFLIYTLMYISLVCSCYKYIFMPSFNCFNDYRFELSKPSVFKQSHQFFESIFGASPRNKHIKNSLYVTKIISIMMR